jgi:hypothetical protein
LNALTLHGFVQGDGHRRGGGVAVLFQVDE